MRAGRRLKRGGGVTHGASRGRRTRTASRGSCRSPTPTDLEAEFQREWARSLLALAVEALRERCRRHEPASVAFALFERYDLEGPTPAERPSYADAGARSCDLPVTQVTNHLHWARRELRATVLETLREITASEAEFRAEARALLRTRTPP